VVEVLTVYTIFVDELVEYPPNDEVMKLGQAEGQRLQWRRCGINIKGAPTCKSHSQATVQISCSSQRTVQVPSSHGSPHPPPPPQSHIHKTFHSDLLLVLKNLHPHHLVIPKTQKNFHPNIHKIHKIFNPHLLLVL
jgi:hypothetical protein